MPARNPESTIRSTTVAASSREPRRELAKDRRVVERLDSGNASRPSAAVSGSTGGAQCDLGQARRPEPAELDRGGYRHEGLVGADVGGRLLPADVLLSRAEGRHVGSASVHVGGLADQPAGNPPHVLRWLQGTTEIWAAEAERGAERLTLSDHHVCPPVAGRPQDAGSHGVEADDEECASAVAQLPCGARKVFEATEIVGVGRPPPRRASRRSSGSARPTGSSLREAASRRDPVPESPK